MSGEAPHHDFGHLTPAEVLDALDAAGLRGDGRILQLNSYENRVYRVMLEDGSAVVAKFYRPGRWSDEQLLEEHDFAHELVAEEVPVIAPLSLAQAASDGAAAVLGVHQTLMVLERPQGRMRLSVSPWQGGRDPTVESPEQWERLGRLLGRVHAVGGRGRFAHRLSLSPALGEVAVRTIEALDLLDPGLASRWGEAARAALQGVQQAFDRARTPAIRLHGDAHRGNLLERGDTLTLVDLDDACNGPPMQDLWLFLDGQDAELGRRQLDWLLRGYEDFTAFDDAQRVLIEPLRTLRLLRHSAWIAQRWSDPAFPRAFPAFGTASWWGDQIAQLQEQVERMG
jgi:Ser/Thr protein kinase RdoA (MazF antagonist)